MHYYIPTQLRKTREKPAKIARGKAAKIVRILKRPLPALAATLYSTRFRGSMFQKSCKLFCVICCGGVTATQKPSPCGGRWRGTRRMRGICPVVAPSSVTCGDSFPQRGKPFRPPPLRRQFLPRFLHGVCRKQKLPVLAVNLDMPCYITELLRHFCVPPFCFST